MFSKKSIFHLFSALLVTVSLAFSTVGVTPARAATFTVTNLNNSGEGSLREAILYANAFAGADIITFNVSGTIALSSILPISTDTAGLTIDGTGQTVTISGNNNAKVMDVVGVGNSLTLNNLAIANGSCSNPCSGAGIRVSPGAMLMINDSTISGNHADAWSDGGGITVGSDCCNPPGTLIINNSTFSGNSARKGGGIYNGGGIVTITNSTFSGNGATQGGGIYSYGGTVTITNSTLSGNTATDDWLSGAGIYESLSTVTLRNTIIANNVGVGNSCSPGGIINGGNNIDDGITCSWGSDSGSMSNTNPLLGTLADNGGFTQTFALLAGSPAINTGNDSICAADPVNNLDQRGIARPQGTHCDIGAYEYVDATPPNVTSSTRANPNPTNQANVNFSVSFSESVTGVDATDFALTAIGVTGATITSVSPDYGATRTVTVNTGSGNGSIRLDVKSSDTSIADTAGNPLNGGFAAGQAYTVNKERILNGGFNLYPGTSNNIPTGWVKSATFAATDGKNTQFKKEGIASVRITGQPGKTKTLTQMLTLNGVIGDKFTFSFWAKGASIPAAGLCQAQVLLYNGAVLKLSRTIPCANGTYATFQKKTLTFNATSAYTKVVIKFTYSKASGTIWFDAVSLIK